MGWRDILVEIQSRYEERVAQGLPITPGSKKGRKRKKGRRPDRKPKAARGPFVMVDVEVVHNETPLAFLMVIDGESQWFPKSQIRHPDLIEVGECDFSFEVTEWIARTKNIVFDMVKE